MQVWIFIRRNLNVLLLTSLSLFLTGLFVLHCVFVQVDGAYASIPMPELPPTFTVNICIPPEFEVPIDPTLPCQASNGVCGASQGAPQEGMGACGDTVQEVVEGASCSTEQADEPSSACCDSSFADIDSVSYDTSCNADPTAPPGQLVCKCELGIPAQGPLISISICAMGTENEDPNSDGCTSTIPDEPPGDPA